MNKAPVKLNKNAQDKNLMVLKILSLVPEFKKDINDLRKEMEINEHGFEWDKSDMWEWACKKEIEYYQGLDQGDEEEGFTWVGITSKKDEEVRKTFPSNFFEKKILSLGTKYKLPFNFYAFPDDGLARFTLSNEIKISHSNYYVDFNEAGDKSIWVSLVAYAPLSVKELKEATDELKNSGMDTLAMAFEGIDVLANTRYRNNLLRDISLFEEQINRSGKPKKVRKSESGSYLDILSKSKATGLTMKTKRVQQIHKKSTLVQYDNPTSKQIGKKIGVTGPAARQAKRRLNLIAKELFGYDLEL